LDICIKNKKFATGISFIQPDNQGCYWALKQAITLYLDYPQVYHKMQQQAMRQLFTWEESAGMYEILFENLLKNRFNIFSCFLTKGKKAKISNQ